MPSARKRRVTKLCLDIRCNLLCPVTAWLASRSTLFKPSSLLPRTLLCGDAPAEGLPCSSINAALLVCHTDFHLAMRHRLAPEAELTHYQTIFQHTTEPAHTSTPQARYLSYRILLLLGTLCLVLRPQLELLLLLFKINQIPLIFQSSLSSLPKLQEKCNCNLEMLEHS